MSNSNRFRDALGGRRQQSSTAGPEPAVQTAATAKTAATAAQWKRKADTVRYTIDCTDEERRALAMVALDAHTGRAEVLRAVFRLLGRDPAFAERVVDEVRRAK